MKSTESLDEHKRVFWNGLQAIHPGTTPDQARELFGQIHPLIPDLNDLRYYVVACFLAEQPITFATASAFARMLTWSN